LKNDIVGNDWKSILQADRLIVQHRDIGYQRASEAGGASGAG
jgi:hypothetical protein